MWLVDQEPELLERVRLGTWSGMAGTLRTLLYLVATVRLLPEVTLTQHRAGNRASGDSAFEGQTTVGWWGPD